jgi:hypothetical protein
MLDGWSLDTPESYVDSPCRSAWVGSALRARVLPLSGLHGRAVTLFISAAAKRRRENR